MNASGRGKTRIAPQEGPQEAFLSTSADIAIYGGAAGGGKSFALLLEPLRHVNNGDFGAVIFRRTSPQIRNEGGLWDTSEQIYRLLGAEPKESTLEWVFPSGMKTKFAHMEHEKNRFDWQGSQIPLIGFDELTHFTERQFTYMLSRNRSATGIPGYIRATTNPDPDSWVLKYISWWIDPETGLAIPERSGVIRWFVRINDKLHWADTREELVSQFGEESLPKSFTFISASVFDNKILLEKDPSYLANLNALPRVEREQLKNGNWKIRPAAGLFFKREYFEIVDAAPPMEKVVRYWDRAATRKTEENDPDFTAGLKLGRGKDGYLYVLDVSRFQESPGRVEANIKNLASQDGVAVKIGIEQDPGQAGVAEANYHVKNLMGYTVKVYPAQKSKEVRANPVSAQAERGNIKLLRGDWNEDFILELIGFPDAPKKDQVDALSGAFMMLNENIEGSWSDQMTGRESQGETIAHTAITGDSW